MNLIHARALDYQSGLLRVWRVGPREAWRASLQFTATGQVYHFRSVEALVAFLVARLAGGGDVAAIETPDGYGTQSEEE